MEKYTGESERAVIDPDQEYIMAIDQGTTGTTVLIVDEKGDIISRGYGEITQIYPRPGWVEHDPEEIWAVSCRAAKEALGLAGLDGTNIKGIGITNQRETTVVWEKESGRPLCNAVVWQCRRTAPLCDRMKEEGLESMVQQKTGLVIDAYFSATKLAWILDAIPGAREKAGRGELLFGTIDSYLVWKLTGGKAHITDYSNASRTMLYNIHSLDWDQELLSYFDIPRAMLPEVHSSSEVYGHTLPQFLGVPVAIAGIAGDQQAALFGQTCFTPGSAKSTYGTGCFLLMNTGETPIHSHHGLLTTIAWGIGGKVHYALEGSVFIAGAAVQWLRDQLQIISTAAESEALAASLSDNGGVYIVPAFVGLGAPHWDMYTRGTVVGLTGGAGRAHLARAVLESIAYQTHDILELMARDAHISLDSLKVDGGASANNFLMQFQSDILEACVERPRVTESTALGAAFLAGLATGYWDDCKQLQNIRKVEYTFTPRLESATRTRLLSGWKRAVDCARSNPIHD
ncbi:MAG: glycerol kinase GlpK [Syntrophomonas sp.]